MHPPISPKFSEKIEKTRKILRNLEQDASLLPEERREIWVKYLRSHTQHYLMVFSLFEDVDSAARILEVGSFPGHLTILLKKMGYSVTGVDISPDAILPLMTTFGIPVIRLDIEREPLPFEDQTCDVAVFTEVFEHLRNNPIHAILEISRVLKPGGLLLFSIPNITPMDRIRFLLGRDYQDSPLRAYQKLQEFGFCGHFRLYSRREATEILQFAGFDMERVVRKGKLPKRIWKWIAYLSGPFVDQFRSHIYFVCRKKIRTARQTTFVRPSDGRDFCESIAGNEF
ncbi:MAG TPA: class I SAM-dependent methyltransferase [bacterium]|nr:class I SAM-dependent methyltransferase [bacterium]HQL62740.1 class I SAM-dependent methyltransferase [bacterium]